MRCGLFLAWTLMVWPVAANAQEIFGTLSDEGAPVAQADVVLLSAKSNLILKRVKTNRLGVYRFTVVSGRYHLRATKKDYAEAWVKGVRVDASDVEINIALVPQVFVDSRIVPPSDDCD